MPGSIRAIRRAVDPIRGRGRVPLSKRSKGHPEFRDTNDVSLSTQEKRIAETLTGIITSISRQTVLEAAESGDIASYGQRVLQALTERSDEIQSVLFDSLVQSGEVAAIELGRDLSQAYRQIKKADAPLPSEVALRFRFNSTDPRAVAWARQETGVLITNMVRSEQEAIRQIVTGALADNRSWQQTGRGIFAQLNSVSPSAGVREFADTLGSNLNGLTQRYEQAVINRVTSVADDLASRGITGTKALDQMRKEGDKYATKLRRARSRTIARTERMRAHNQARLLSFEQAIDSGLASREHSRKQWQTGPFDVCNICVPMQGVQAKVSDAFTLPNGAMVVSPPAHPNCRCNMTMVTDVRLYDPPQTLGTGQPGDPFRIGQRQFSEQGRQLAGRPVTDVPMPTVPSPPRPGARDSQEAFSQQSGGRTMYDPKRIQDVHDPWVQKNLRDGIAYEDTQVTFMGGGSGAGKGSIRESGQVKFRKGSTLVDSDEAKRAIPEYRKMLDAGDSNAAAYAHAESSDMASRLMAESIERGYDTVLDGTGNGTFEKLAGRVADARQRGAKRVTAEYVTIDTDEALRRAAMRAQDTGREVPEKVIRSTHENVSRIFPEAAERNLFDELRLWDNMGDEPILVYERVDGVERILNPERYEAFLRKNPDYVPPSPTTVTIPEPSVARHGKERFLEMLDDGWYETTSNGKDIYTVTDINDAFLRGIIREQGFDTRPTIVPDEQFAELWREEFEFVYRGINAESDEQLAKYLRNFVEEDDFYVGKGIYGNGVYTTTIRETAEAYAETSGLGVGFRGETVQAATGRVLDIAIHPSARIVELNDLAELKRAEKTIVRNRQNELIEMQPTREVPHPYRDGEMMMEKIPLHEIPADHPYAESAKELQRLLEYENVIDANDDVGRFAAMLGYDAIRVGTVRQFTMQGVIEQSDSYFVILNRGAVVVREGSL
jgi:predicted ABC-type ATPase